MTNLLKELTALVEFHKTHCPPYQKILNLFYPTLKNIKTLSEVPYFPVNLFKTQDLLSIPKDKVFKILRSSGTTSSHPSKIYLDAETAQKQTEALAEIMTSILGPKRLPMIILDHSKVVEDRYQYNARGAAIIGMSTFGRDLFYAFNEKMELDVKGLKTWLSAHQNSPLLIFGLTSVIWEHFLKKIGSCDLSQAILMHTGGWKKLQDQAVTNEIFKEKLKKTCQITRCYNFYGMVEQVGSVFVECDEGFLHCPAFAEVIVRDPRTWKEAPFHQEGLIQVLSILPKSYPGHSLLTEDQGIVLGVDDCPCGRKGKYFQVTKRVPQAEIRGCSDTYIYAKT